MILDRALELVKQLHSATQQLPGRFTYEVRRLDEPYKKWWRDWPKLFGADSVSALEIRQFFGVYLFARAQDQKVIYIGRAMPRSTPEESVKKRYNLATELLSKIRTPVIENGTPQFSKSPLVAKVGLDASTRQTIMGGDFLVDALEIKPWNFAAYVETYLQAVVVVEDGTLPAANDRIG
jgi:hypothetical protein